ncbi:hypothetical protein [Hamadaea tsunoensis]|uniref:hypothetical protein n=1 Tax=Hamadaea tsunoensis TaxID=53368 RepID=UPI000489DE40|nr:hypothetical protein [Hamadaea tsunoensis]
MAVAMTAGTTVSVAVLGFLFTYFHTRRLQGRSDRLSRVNRQLTELYGPAFSLSDSTRISFESFCAKYDDVRQLKDDQEQLTVEQRSAWQAWMTIVFQPSNKRIYEILMTKADLLVDETMPACISEFCSHVTSYDVVMAGWENGSQELFAAIDYPPDFTTYVRNTYTSLKRRQAALLDE